MNIAAVWSRQRFNWGMLIAVLAVASIKCSAQIPSSDSYEQRNGSSLNGRVITSSRLDLRGARIELLSMMGQAVCSAYIDASGSFHCSDVAPGMYRLTVSAGVMEQTFAVSVASFNPEVTVSLADRKPEQDPNKAVSVSELMVPSKARKAFEKAKQRFQRADLAGAQSLVDQAIDIWPRFAAALTLRGLLKTNSNMPSDAVKDFSAALDVDRGYGLAYIGLAASHSATGNFDKAMSVLDRGRPYIVQMWQYHYEASKALLGKGAFDRALEEANRASAMLGKDLPGLCFIKAQAYLNIDNPRAARSEVETCLKKSGKEPGVERLRELLAAMDAR